MGEVWINLMVENSSKQQITILDLGEKQQECFSPTTRQRLVLPLSSIFSAERYHKTGGSCAHPMLREVKNL